MLQLPGILQKVDTEQDRRDLRLSQIKDLRNQSANKEKLPILQVDKNLFIVFPNEQQKISKDTEYNSFKKQLVITLLTKRIKIVVFIQICKVHLGWHEAVLGPVRGGEEQEVRTGFIIHEIFFMSSHLMKDSS